MRNPFFKQQILVVILLAIGFMAAIYKVTRPNYGLIHFAVERDTAYVNGRTDSSSLDVMQKFLRDNPQIRRLVLGNMLGTSDADTNIKIAYLIRKKGLDIHLKRNSYIASGAVDWFIAGTRRTMECGAKIGVHSWSFRGDNIGVFSPENMGSDRRQKYHEKFLSDMGANPDFYVSVSYTHLTLPTILLV